MTDMKSLFTFRPHGLAVKPLTKKESEVFIMFWSYSDEGRLTMSVREMHEAFQVNQAGAEDDWDWHDYTPTTLGSTMRMLEARSLVVSDDKNPASWSMTEIGQRYGDALGDRDAKALILQEGYERYLDAIDGTHDHADVRRRGN